MRKRRSFQLNIGNNEINLSPLIDMVFILLIFFIIASVFLEEPSERVDRVITTNAERLESNSILLAITHDNHVLYSDDIIPLDQVKATLDRLIRKEKMPVMLQVDRESHSDVLIQVLKQAKSLELETVIATSNKI